MEAVGFVLSGIVLMAGAMIQDRAKPFAGDRMKPVVVMSSDASIDLKSVRGVRAGCSAEAPNLVDFDGLIDPAATRSGPDGDPSTVLRSTG